MDRVSVLDEDSFQKEHGVGGGQLLPYPTHKGKLYMYLYLRIYFYSGYIFK